MLNILDFFIHPSLQDTFKKKVGKRLDKPSEKPFRLLWKEYRVACDGETTFIYTGSPNALEWFRQDHNGFKVKILTHDWGVVIRQCGNDVTITGVDIPTIHTIRDTTGRAYHFRKGRLIPPEEVISLLGQWKNDLDAVDKMALLPDYLPDGWEMLRPYRRERWVSEAIVGILDDRRHGAFSVGDGVLIYKSRHRGFISRHGGEIQYGHAGSATIQPYGPAFIVTVNKHPKTSTSLWTSGGILHVIMMDITVWPEWREMMPHTVVFFRYANEGGSWEIVKRGDEDITEKVRHQFGSQTDFSPEEMMVIHML